MLEIPENIKVLSKTIHDYELIPWVPRNGDLVWKKWDSYGKLFLDGGTWIFVQENPSSCMDAYTNLSDVLINFIWVPTISNLIQLLENAYFQIKKIERNLEINSTEKRFNVEIYSDDFTTIRKFFGDTIWECLLTAFIFFLEIDSEIEVSDYGY